MFNSSSQMQNYALDSIKSEECLTEAYSNDVRPYIDLIDNLRLMGVDQDVNLPTVVVVGDQSSGKSSIIEALSGIQLPRGSGIVTRCPLELQLIRGKPTSPWIANLKYRNNIQNTFKSEDVGALICAAQNNICGQNKNVVNELLTLRIEDPRPTAPDLTLIDLPGISRTPVEGQPDDVCETIRGIVKKYISNPNTIILCMVSANLDIAVNEALQIAKSVDKTYARTFGVITKPDLADQQQKLEVMKIIENKKYALQKGYLIVKCRSQQELDEDLPLEDSVQNEMEFFDADPQYKYIDPDKKGIHNLAKRITEELVKVIKNSIPSLKIKIDEELRLARQKLASIPESIPTENNKKTIYLSKRVNEVNTSVKEYIEKGLKVEVKHNEFYKLRTEFKNYLEKIELFRKVSFQNEFKHDKLMEKIEENRGPEISLFLNFQLFRVEFRNYLKQYIVPAETITKNVTELIQNGIMDIVTQKLNFTPLVLEDFKKEITKLAWHHKEDAVKNIKWLFKQEELIYTSDVLFKTEFDKLMDGATPIMMSEYMQVNDSQNAKLMQKLLKIYIKIVNMRLCDQIPMIIMQSLMVDLFDAFAQYCNGYLYNPDVCEKVVEIQKIRSEREKWFKKAERLQEAHQKLSIF